MHDYEKSSGPELKLIKRAKHGDTKAFSALYSRIYTDMYRFALYMLGSPHDAEDAVSETVIAAYEGISRLRKDESFRSWIFVILSNRCMKILRSRGREASSYGAEDTPKSARHDMQAGSDFTQEYVQGQEVREALAGLNEEERMIVVFSVFGGYSSEEIGGILKMNAVTVRSKKSRALGRMRRVLENDSRERKVDGYGRKRESSCTGTSWPI